MRQWWNRQTPQTLDPSGLLGQHQRRAPLKSDAARRAGSSPAQRTIAETRQQSYFKLTVWMLQKHGVGARKISVSSNAVVAQLAEQRFCKPQVKSSSLFNGSTFLCSQSFPFVGEAITPIKNTIYFGVWCSSVACLIWDQEVASSNLATPTISQTHTANLRVILKCGFNSHLVQSTSSQMVKT